MGDLALRCKCAGCPSRSHGSLLTVFSDHFLCPLLQYALESNFSGSDCCTLKNVKAIVLPFILPIRLVHKGNNCDLWALVILIWIRMNISSMKEWSGLKCQCVLASLRVQRALENFFSFQMQRCVAAFQVGKEKKKHLKWRDCTLMPARSQL